MNSQDLGQILEQVQFACFAGASPGTVSAAMKKLALAQYPPAAGFFATCLKDRRQEWRAQALLLLGYHYDLSGNPQALEALRQMLKHDDDAQLRRKAAEILALYAVWPEQALVDAMQSDPAADVQFAAFQAILELSGVPRMKVRDAVGMLRASRRLPSMRDVEQMTQSGPQKPDGLF